MHDPRFDKLADVLTRHSTKLKAGEKVLIDIFDAPDAMAISLIQATRSRGAIPFVQMHHARVSREIALGAEEAHLTIASGVELARMKKWMPTLRSEAATTSRR